jgi:hypothetical protein
VLGERMHLKKKYDKICSCIPEFKQFGFQEYCKAMTLVCSRSLGLKVEGKLETCMVPLADMFNFTPNK